MAMPNIEKFSDLQHVVQSWLNRKDQRTLDSIGMFINMAEAEVYRGLRVEEFLKTTAVTVEVGKVANLPDDIETLKNVFIRTTGHHVTVLARVSLSDLDSHKEGFAIVGDTLYVTEDVNEGDIVTIEYYANQPYMRASTDSTPLLELAPDLLLFTTLDVAARWSNDNDEVAKWSELKKQAYASLVAREELNDYSGGVLSVRNIKQGLF